MGHTQDMSTEQEDRGVEPESEEIILTGDGVQEVVEPGHVVDGIGEPAATEDDLGGD